MARANYLKYAVGAGGRTGIRVGGFLQAAQKLFDRAEGLRRDKVEKFKVFCQGVFDRIKARTPVDTGLAQGSWTIAFTENEDVGTVGCTISNPVFYVIYLEYGHSQKQAPNGMVRITLAEARIELKEALL